MEINQHVIRSIEDKCLERSEKNYRIEGFFKINAEKRAYESLYLSTSIIFFKWPIRSELKFVNVFYFWNNLSDTIEKYKKTFFSYSASIYYECTRSRVRSIKFVHEVHNRSIQYHSIIPSRIYFFFPIDDHLNFVADPFNYY